MQTNEATAKSWIMIAILGVIWGSSFMAVSIAIQGFGPLTVAAIRITIGAVMLYSLTRILGIALPVFSGREGRLTWLAALGFGFCSMALPFFLLSWGQQYVSSGFAGVTMAAVPLLVLPLAHFLVPGDQMTLPKAIGFIVGFAGVVVLIGLSAFDGGSSGGGLETLAKVACLGASVGYAFGGIITRLAPKVDPIAFAASATILGALMISPIAFSVEGIPEMPETMPLIAVIFLGVVPTAMANLLLVAVIRSAGPSFLSLVNYQVPIWSVIFGAVFLSEALPPSTFYALALILGGVGLSQIKTLRRLFQRN
ncbi:MAG: DMT family transporter [Rhodobacterales bacterium]|nr:DMT family transporter [Rhodobacterales bacterium]